MVRARICESPPGAEREWDAYDHNKDSHVHRMPNESVETSRDDFLVFNYLDRRTSVAIFSEHEQVDEQSKRDQHISNH